ncbi:hypothetical protein [Rossellomorea aquimaris]|uniref:hypothetical protein n=1 Tax=Rossellomorea aquimaris TaxID=189382 RepID=UPI0011E8B009|nr:hypothetical protein [Rossellomorea aquimaris]TYS89297.1 hypothetical protein FZC88_14755 [Rossellomorea aquimaris]
MNIVEEYDKEISGRLVSIEVRYEQGNAVSSLNVDGSGKTLEEAKARCENATKMEIIMNR